MVAMLLKCQHVAWPREWVNRRLYCPAPDGFRINSRPASSQHGDCRVCIKRERARCDEHLKLCLACKGKPVATDSCRKAEFFKMWVAILYQIVKSHSWNVTSCSSVESFVDVSEELLLTCSGSENMPNKNLVAAFYFRRGRAIRVETSWRKRVSASHDIILQPNPNICLPRSNKTQ